MGAVLEEFGWQLPLTTEQQSQITPRQLAKLIVEILLRNDQMPPNERNWRVSYYPYQLSSIRAFEIVGHSRPELPSFARKWSEALAILQSKALIMRDPTQDRDDFVMPTSIASSTDLDKALDTAA